MLLFFHICHVHLWVSPHVLFFDGTTHIKQILQKHPTQYYDICGKYNNFRRQLDESQAYSGNHLQNGIVLILLSDLSDLHCPFVKGQLQSNNIITSLPTFSQGETKSDCFDISCAYIQRDLGWARTLYRHSQTQVWRADWKSILSHCAISTKSISKNIYFIFRILTKRDQVRLFWYSQYK